jgi:transcriptional regulator with XRE-family HTH domain
MALQARIDPVPGDVKGQRSAPRRELLLETSGSLPGGVEANVTIHNISLAGLLIETREPLGEGDTLKVDLPDAGQVDARIVWASGQLYGCAFEQALGQGALAATQLRAPVAPTSLPRSGRALAEPFGIKLNRLRRERNMTLADIAGALGVSKPTVWAWEKSKARPVPSRIPDIAKALGVTVQDLGEAAPANEASAITEECRARIASAHATDPIHVRIMIEV